jgi:uncharacterized membrane protein
MIYMAVAAAAFFISRDYAMGSAGRMGPGYFPTAVAGLLFLVGAVAVARAFLQPGEVIGTLPFKPLLLIVGSVVSFGLLLPLLGLVLALIIVVLLSAAASDHFRFHWLATAGLIGLVAFCSALFVFGLGVPMPLVGSWLQPLLPAAIGG